MFLFSGVIVYLLFCYFSLNLREVVTNTPVSSIRLEVKALKSVIALHSNSRRAGRNVKKQMVVRFVSI